MLHADNRVLRATWRLHELEVLREAETRRVLREAGLYQEPWPSRVGGWLFCQAGHLFIMLGRRLQRHGLARMSALEE
jgi:hypothetical protein